MSISAATPRGLCTSDDGREEVKASDRKRRLVDALLVLLAASGCAGSNRVTTVPAARPPASQPVVQVVADLKAYEKRVGFEPTGNFVASSGEAFPGRCYYTGLLELPESYRELHLAPIVNGQCSVPESEYDVFSYPLETAATGKSAITPALESATLERVLMVVPHEDFHNQPEMRAAPPEAAEAAATIVGFLTAAGFARDQYGADSQLFGRMGAEAARFLAKASIVNDYYDRVAQLYASYRAGRMGRDEALSRKRELFDGLRTACMALEPPPVSFNRCPAVMNNAGLAFDRTYTRAYPAIFDLYTRLGDDLTSTIAALRRLLPRWPGEVQNGSDLVVDALQSEGAAAGLAGQWIAADPAGRLSTLTFRGGGVFEVEFQGDDTIEVSGRYEVTGNRLTLTDEGGIAACLAPEYGPGIYRFTIRNNELTLDAVKDGCAGRAMILQQSGASKHSWNRKKA